MLGREVTSSASSPSTSRSFTSDSMRAGRRSATIAGRQKTDEPLEPQAIAFGAETGDYADGKIREQRVPPLGLAAENVREMDLHEWHAHGEQRIAHGETGMRERGRIDDRAVGMSPQA